MNEDELHEEELDEELAELEHVDRWSEGAVLWSTDWTAETVISQLRRGTIELDPIFQRRSAWTSKRQSLFIESLVLGLPIPQLILAEDPHKKGAYIVIDGKQRLLAIRQFAASVNEEDADRFRPLRLTGLDELSELNGTRYSDLIANEDFADYRSAFENSSVRTVVIRNWKSESYLYEVFLRINTGSVKLSPQELRQALHPGPFSSFVNAQSADSAELQAALGLKKPDFRMRDAEILLRHLAYKNFHEDYAGNLKKFLDTTTQRLNVEWGLKEPLLNDQVAEMNAAFEFTKRAFDEKDYLRKWNGDEFERRKNRAVIDIMLFFFSQPDVRDALDPVIDQIKPAFIRLCDQDVEFLNAIERTTKTPDANQKRFNAWAATLREIADVEIEDLTFVADDAV